MKQADLEKSLFKLQQISQTKKEKLELREVNTVVNERGDPCVGASATLNSGEVDAAALQGQTGG